MIHPRLGSGSWCIRHINGGIKTTLNVPDKCELFIDRFVVPGEDYEFCSRQIMELANELGIEKKVKVFLIPRETPYMEPFVIPEDHILVKIIREKYKEVVGKDLPIGYDKSVCDSNYLYRLGNIPTVTFGPGGENMHSPNECGYISQIIACTQIYLETINELMF
ncbi:M20/M25/M40 family metallo-hydrolase [Thermovenabulum sp.]|uniref:M20/M25/M40 family metallo-hydrolase n=1 Tax=Thermovenabulum sp. TaxID=3100335 RepID=UPI003C7B8E82